MGNQETESLVVVRVYVHPHPYFSLSDENINYVKDRWVKTYKKCNRFMKLVDPEAYYAVYPSYVRTILERQNTVIRLASLADDPDVLLGFSVSEGTKLHYLNVPLDYRGQGIARKLVPFGVESFTHITETGMKLWAKKAPEAKFNPFG